MIYEYTTLPVNEFVANGGAWHLFPVWVVEMCHPRADSEYPILYNTSNETKPLYVSMWVCTICQLVSNKLHRKGYANLPERTFKGQRTAFSIPLPLHYIIYQNRRATQCPRLTESGVKLGTNFRFVSKFYSNHPICQSDIHFLTYGWYRTIIVGLEESKWLDIIYTHM